MLTLKRLSFRFGEDQPKTESGYNILKWDGRDLIISSNNFTFDIPDNINDALKAATDMIRENKVEDFSIITVHTDYHVYE